MRKQRTSTITSRRGFLATAGITASAALSGCTSSGTEGNGTPTDANGSTTVRMKTGPQASAAYTGNQGIAAVTNENTDELFVEAQTSAGTEANVGALAREEAEMVYISHWTARLMAEGIDPYGDLGFQPAQIHHFSNNIWWFATANEEIDYLSDVTPDTTVSPTPEGSGTAPGLEHALSYVVDDYERISVPYGSQGSALQEGRLDVGIGVYTNDKIVPGFAQQMLSTGDGRVLTATDETVSQWEDDERLLVGSFDGDILQSATSTPDTVHAPMFAYNFISRADLDYDTVYKYLETLYENRDGLGEYAAIIEILENKESWTQNAYENIPFHPAAADFYEEIGIWQDDFERAE